jgi:DNA polymerase-1
MHRVLEAMNIAVLEMSGYEADDIIGTLSVKGTEAGFRTLIISGDKDGLQLVSPSVHVLINKRGMSEFDVYDEAAMKERYSLTPKQFIDLKGLMGDKSDNIPGVPGIGEKKGIALLEQYGSVEGVLEHADEIKGKMGENIRANEESARAVSEIAMEDWDAFVEHCMPEGKYGEEAYINKKKTGFADGIYVIQLKKAKLKFYTFWEVGVWSYTHHNYIKCSFK